jgi:hypothetical protein
MNDTQKLADIRKRYIVCKHKLIKEREKIKELEYDLQFEINKNKRSGLL